ncbi:transporter substrate-binding domain-containing protein [uncultured Roseobacter sp.]|uniref:transporter substrate-binding domain-containing protein n=1 Tax=uncultured Roseobacter sp. TaxID=114847 RepID=UPI00261BC1ED|nr:transporter substrate-binding domain-containing protein [uncultured Roseobacter sp.]
MVRLFFYILVLCAFGPGNAMAQACGGDYEVARGDSLSLIANRLYKDAGKWTAIHTVNRSVIGEDPDKILVGTRLELACINGLSKGMSPRSAVSGERLKLDAVPAKTNFSQPSVPPVRSTPLRVVTGDDQAPFSDHRLPQGGMLAEVMDQALQRGLTSRTVKTFRINDWASHLEPLLTGDLMDVSYPWPKPDCDDLSGAPICQAYAFSDPMFEMLMVMFVDADKPVPLANTEDIHGKKLCRPAGRMVFMLDAEGRGWLRNGLIELVRAPTVSGCFDLLVRGDVDAVVVNEFTGRNAVATLGLTDRVTPLRNTPLGIVTLHAVVSKQHPQSQKILAALNDGLRKLKRDGGFQDILDRHLSAVWAGL